MIFKSEASAMQIGVENSITKAVVTGEWGVRLSFRDDNYSSIYEVVLSEQDSQILISQMQKSLASIDEIRQQIITLKAGE
jgi:hypothetical protein